MKIIFKKQGEIKLKILKPK